MKLTMERGNGLLEMIIFLPLAMMILFVLTDCAFAMLERARMSDAVREALRAQGVLKEVPEVLFLDDALQPAINVEASYSAAQKAANELGAMVLEAKADTAGFNHTQFRASASIVILGIDPESGSATHIDQVLTVVSEAGNPTIDLTSMAPAYNYIPQEEYLNALLEKESTASPSRFSISLEHKYELNGGPAEQVQYLDRGALLYGEVSVLSQAINPMLAEGLLGSMFAVQEQIAVPIKKVF